MSKVTLSSGREVEVKETSGAEMRTSNGAAVTSTRGDGPKGNQLLAYINGGSIKALQKQAPQTGFLSNLWNPYVSPSRDWTRAGITGADVGALLCVLGYIEIQMTDKLLEAGTNESNLPSAEMLKAVNPPFQAVKPLPSFTEFTEIMKAIRKQRA